MGYKRNSYEKSKKTKPKHNCKKKGKKNVK